MKEIYKELERIKKDRGWRIGQIIANAVNLTDKASFDPFYVEDEKLLKNLKKL